MKKVNMFCFKLVALFLLDLVFIITLLFTHWVFPILVGIAIFFLCRNIVLCIKSFFFDCYSIVDVEDRDARA